ncbi:MAG: hypothetical protein ACP5D7_20575 [Limnospira sp.]
MSTQNHQPVNTPVSSDRASTVKDTMNGPSQRAHEIAHQNRESRTATDSEMTENTVLVKIPRAMNDKLTYLINFLGLATDDLIHASIQSIISYAQQKQIEIRQIGGYPQEKIPDSDHFTQPVELSGNVFEELKQQDLLSDVSECAVLGIEFLYLRLIELNKIG